MQLTSGSSSQIPCGPKPIRTISECFWNLVAEFEFDFRRCGNYFLNDSNFCCVQRFNHTHNVARTCACAVACLHPHNSISNVVVSVTTCVYVYAYVFFVQVSEYIP